MPEQDYNRYTRLKQVDNTYLMMPFVEIPQNTSDKSEYWSAGISRLDKLSKKYYDNSFWDFIILYANPEYISEFDIPDGALIRIPFPIGMIKTYYENYLDNYFKK